MKSVAIFLSFFYTLQAMASLPPDSVDLPHMCKVIATVTTETQDARLYDLFLEYCTEVDTSSTKGGDAQLFQTAGEVSGGNLIPKKRKL